MTLEEKIRHLKILLKKENDEKEIEERYEVFLTIAGEKILRRAYPYDDTVTEVPEKYHALQCEIAAYLYDKIGAEGQVTHSENGIQRQYENADVPKSMMNVVVPMCGVV